MRVFEFGVVGFSSLGFNLASRALGVKPQSLGGVCGFTALGCQIQSFGFLDFDVSKRWLQIQSVVSVEVTRGGFSD